MGIPTDAKAPLARIRVEVFRILADVGMPASINATLKWMPAHGSQNTIGRATCSDGSIVTAVRWRPNRLADLLAKNAAMPARIPAKARRLIGIAAEAVEYSLVKLGVVTYAANHFADRMHLPDGTTTTVILRDASGVRTKKRAVTDESMHGSSSTGGTALALPASTSSSAVAPPASSSSSVGTS